VEVEEKSKEGRNWLAVFDWRSDEQYGLHSLPAMG
jgi:hypothetical protein